MDRQYTIKISDIIDKFIISLNDINNLSLDNVRDKQLLKSFDNIRNIIFKGISNIKFNVENLSKITEWEKLNISFFGETNAGKSTLIEALTNGDGNSIGEGYKDFTKRINKIAYKNIILMDMPGIEGRESKVIRNIHTAINKSHVVFYVIGTNKEPEENTIYKIRNLLKDNVKVYSIINVRGKPTVYKYKKKLIDDNIRTVEGRIITKLQKYLQGNYAGNFITNGHLALLKAKKMKYTRFKNDRAKAFTIFGTEDKIESFSNITEINNLIDLLSSELKDEIKISNTYKFLKGLESILSKILHEKKNFDKFIKETNLLTKNYLDDVDKIVKKYETEINSSLEVNINKLKVELKKSITASIDAGDSESTIKSKLDRVKKEQSKTLDTSIKELLSAMNDEINGKIKEFKGRMSLQMKSLNFKGEFSLDNILETLELNFKYILGQIIDVGASIWGVVLAFGINPILGVVAGVLALARKIWDWFCCDPDKRKREAKQKAVRQLDSLINDIEIKVKKDMNRELLKVNKNTKKPVVQLVNSMKGIKNISLSIDDKISDIKTSQLEISLLLIKDFLGEKIIFSYIDLSLSEVIIVGFSVSSDNLKQLTKKLRVKIINIFPTIKDWIKSFGVQNCSNTIVVNNEFSYRAINALLLQEPDDINIQKVIRS